MNELTEARLTDLGARRYEAFQEAGSKGEHDKFREYAAEVTTRADIDLLNEVFQGLSVEMRKYVQLRTDIWAEFRSGKRCSVCGNTAKQSKALGYDCVAEC